MLRNVYRKHGEFCAQHPWEVIVMILTVTSCLITMDNSVIPLSKDPPYHCQAGACHMYKVIDAVVMTAIRCVAILYSYYQLRNLYNLGSKYLVAIAGLFTVFSSFIFCSSVIKFLGGDVSDLKDALFFFLLLIDLSKATQFVQIALSASDPKEIEGQIAKGMEIIGPSATLDTIVETLVISIGTLSGIHRFEVLSYYACMSVIINFLIFMTFYPACLSLILDLSRIENDNSKSDRVPVWQDKILERFQSFKTAFKNDVSINKPNPVVERVKVIMSLGLVVVHLSSRWSLVADSKDSLKKPNSVIESDETNDDPSFEFFKFMSLSAEHMVVLIIIVSLVVKFMFFEKQNTELMDIKEKENKVIVANKSNEVTVTSVCEECSKKIQDLIEPEPRSLEVCSKIFESSGKVDDLTDGEIERLIREKVLAGHQLEKLVKNASRCVEIRRRLVGESLGQVPFRYYDYTKVVGQCCENVVGYVPVPLGVAGPLRLDGVELTVPLATTEGCLVASTNRGFRALNMTVEGVVSRVEDVGMTRGPVVRFPSAVRSSAAQQWIKESHNFETLKKSFDATSRFARLKRVDMRIAGRQLYIRFVALTGDAMGMNMVSKGTEASLETLKTFFPDMEVMSLSGNFCSDKKPAAVNWLLGRGKSVVCEAIVPGDVVRKVLKTDVRALVETNTTKNLLGSAIAGSIGGYNAHAANIVTAMFIATGQDPAQTVGSSNCLTWCEVWGPDQSDLYISCTMPCIEVGTVGGGTGLPAQAGCLKLLGVHGPHPVRPGTNAESLARVVCATVMAAELSLLAALTAGHLVNSHLQHNRKSSNICQQQ